MGCLCEGSQRRFGLAVEVNINRFGLIANRWICIYIYNSYFLLLKVHELHVRPGGRLDRRHHWCPRIYHCLLQLWLGSQGVRGSVRQDVQGMRFESIFNVNIKFYRIYFDFFFALYQTQGAVEVNREEFAVLWREYFSSDDPSAAGNFIFGKTSF